MLDAYGHRLLAEHQPVVLSFLQKGKKQCEQIMAGLPAEDTETERIAQRRAELMEQLVRNQTAMAYINR